MDKKREKELQVVSLMIDLYCHHNHHTKKAERCLECQDLVNYAKLRISKCPFMETKTFCSNCKVHCYQEEYREKIKKVMRFSGPRMIFHHPILAFKHLFLTIKEKNGQ